MEKIARLAALFVLLVSFSVPAFASAQGGCPAGQTYVCSEFSCDCYPNTPSSSRSAPGGINPTYLQGYSQSIVGVINSLLIPVLMAIAFIVFLYGVYKYFILGADSDTERATGRQFVLWGIIGFVVILSVWALVYVVMSTFGLSIMAAPPTPKL